MNKVIILAMLLICSSCMYPRVEIRQFAENVYKIECYNDLSACYKEAKETCNYNLMRLEETKDKIVEYREVPCQVSIQEMSKLPIECEMHRKGAYIQKSTINYTTYHMLIGCNNE